MPFIALLGATSDLIVLLPKLPAPLPNRLVGEENPALKHHFFDVTVAQGKL